MSLSEYFDVTKTLFANAMLTVGNVLYPIYFRAHGYHFLATMFYAAANSLMAALVATYGNPIDNNDFRGMLTIKASYLLGAIVDDFAKLGIYPRRPVHPSLDWDKPFPSSQYEISEINIHKEQLNKSNPLSAFEDFINNDLDL